MFKVICLLFVASAAVPPFTYRLPSPVYKTYATTNSLGKSPSSLSPETSTLVLPAEIFRETTFESSTDATDTSVDETMQKTGFASENATTMPVESIGLSSNLRTHPTWLRYTQPILPQAQPRILLPLHTRKKIPILILFV